MWDRAYDGSLLGSVSSSPNPRGRRDRHVVSRVPTATAIALENYILGHHALTRGNGLRCRANGDDLTGGHVLIDRGVFGAVVVRAVDMGGRRHADLARTLLTVYVGDADVSYGRSHEGHATDRAYCPTGIHGETLSCEVIAHPQGRIKA